MVAEGIWGMEELKDAIYQLSAKSASGWWQFGKDDSDNWSGIVMHGIFLASR